MQTPILEYQGRVPKRAGSLAKRNLILQATLDLIEHEGLRAVRHRAVAAAAKVPLSATTYYFQDIDELIVDSFVYFMEQNVQQQQLVFSEILNAIDELDSSDKGSDSILELIHQQLVSYIEQQVSDKSSRVIERAFSEYASRIPALAIAVLCIQEYFEQQIIALLTRLKVDEVEFKAQLILSFISFIEDRFMLSGKLDKTKIEANISQLLNKVFV